MPLTMGCGWVLDGGVTDSAPIFLRMANVLIHTETCRYKYQKIFYFSREEMLLGVGSARY
jgi:hypothetical protein